MSTKVYPSGVIEGPTRRYIVNAVRGEGDLTTLYEGTYANGGGDNHVVVIKVSRDKADNDLVWNEAGILGFIYPPTQEEERLYKLFPRLIDSFETRDGHRANVLARIDDRVSFEEILRAYPKGIDYRDMAWMYKRTLMAIGFAHSKGVIHGAVLPPHVLVHPIEHGCKLLDWSYALNFAALVKPASADPPMCEHGTPGCRGRGDKHACMTPAAAPAPAPHKAANAWEKLLEDPVFDPDPVGNVTSGPPADPNRMYVKAMSVDWADYYAPEILLKQTPTPATDIFMAAKCAVALLGGDAKTNQLPEAVPPQIKAFLQASLGKDPKSRSQEAWDLCEQFDKLMLQLVPRKHRIFTMPAKN